MNGIISTLFEQASFDFTGHVNILDQATSQHLGEVTMSGGKIVNGKFKNKEASKALYSLIIEDLGSCFDFKIVVVPEIVDKKDMKLDLTVQNFKSDCEKVYKRHLDLEKLRPPSGLKLLAVPDFISKGAEISFEEFSVLSLVSEYNKVKSIYQKSNLLEFEVTEALVSLRKKGAIKVLKDDGQEAE